MTSPVSMYEKYFKDPKREPVLIDYVRTPMGRRRGTIGRHRGDDLVVHCYQTILARNEFDPTIIGDSISKTSLNTCSISFRYHFRSP